MVSELLMDSSSSSLSPSPASSSTDKSKEPKIPAQLKFLMSNVKSVISTQLSTENHPIWKSQILKLFSANGFEGFLTGTNVKPQKQLLATDGTVSLNPLYQTWMLVDQNLAAALYSTISQSFLPYVLNLETSHEIWLTIEKRLQSTNRSRQLQLKSELHHVQKGEKSMVQYLSEIKQKVDAITTAGSTIDPQDILLYTLNGLPASYNAFKTAIRTQLQPISLDEFYSLLISEELSILSELTVETMSTSDDTALNSTTFRGRSRGRQSFNNRGRSTSQ
ncbi:hypothetical protein KFK09_019387 [Dendrobium nobile]|uniref:Retrovirus-related Pol polyprotein from transposon TNT 1-94 n=1 Tax=Dendrobium nobile TaxID=94219 RepID=A0A8T3AQ45_DENNO|nr:hypothetical protein KFK09_019387 [Dendrobium nobile]